MSGFPTLKPAFTVTVDIAPPEVLANVSKSGAPLNVVPMTAGTVKSEPGFELALDATFNGTGHDFIRQDPSGKHLRLDVRSTVTNKDGAIIALYYTGVVAITPGVAAALSGAPDAKTTDYGDSFTHFTFETGAEHLKALETSVFVGAGHFIVEPGKPLVVQYKVSQVIKG
ncbi:hypothetical protein L228DRAFT_264888 [Xylona heveae TC161]|uniref:Uncharacterized protein n=1 Tax=Xylona heveae (strain CBS 132557 / TC161) TaxID=1328760 RepID=A0A165JQ39_XYLHT|nr:hypothetical protein L228DRAFT_264888 [Xylona heveae TC161]KZF26502.1 hypothetical protein L228DRAFT_264888 [Xylona heveae TC161]